MSLHHTSDPNCPLCEEKLSTAHPELQGWFKRIKKKYENTHISWAWRGQADQEAFYNEGRTKEHWPRSPHNHMEDGKPLSLALDLFQIDEDGVARFSPMFYARLNADNEEAKEPIFWGGKFKHLGDYDHFQFMSSEVAA